MLLLALFSFIMLMGQKTAAVLVPGYEYVQEADTWLRLHIVPAKWKDARLFCKLEGGMLASPSTTDLTEAMLSMMSRYKHVVPRGVFTGIHDLISEGDFMSLDGMPVSDMQLDWAYDELSDGNEEEDCLILNHEGRIAEEKCDSKFAYFCRKESAVMNVSYECRTSQKGYVYEPRTNSCYKFHRVAQTWHRAAKICNAEGGHLAIINSETEAHVIKDIFEDNPARTIIGASHDFLALIGVWKWNEEDSEWVTIHDQTLDEAGFSLWSDGQPNNLGGDQTVLSAHREDGKLDDISPHIKEAFICEISLSIQ